MRPEPVQPAPVARSEALPIIPLQPLKPLQRGSKSERIAGEFNCSCIGQEFSPARQRELQQIADNRRKYHQENCKRRYERLFGYYKDREKDDEQQCPDS